MGSTKQGNGGSGAEQYERDGGGNREVVRTCGSCHARIRWLHNETTGWPAPIDAGPTDAGNITINWLTLRYRVLSPTGAEAVRAAYAEEGLTPPLYTNHFVTCPHAQRWARKHAGRAQDEQAQATAARAAHEAQEQQQQQQQAHG